MRKNHRFISEKTLFIIFSVLATAVLCFIFTQSILSKQDSGTLSGRISALLKPILDPYDRIDAGVFHHLVRKAAHFTEFAALGFCVMGATVNLGVLKGRKFVALPMWITLLCAVCDELLQYFTGRGSMVTDVVLDYSGALFGMAIMAVIHILIRRCKQ